MTFSMTGLPHYQSAAAGSGNGDPESTSSQEMEMVSMPASGIETTSVLKEEVDSGSPFPFPAAAEWSNQITIKELNMYIRKVMMTNFNFHFSVAGMHNVSATQPGLWTCHDLQRDRPTPLPVRIRRKR